MEGVLGFPLVLGTDGSGTVAAVGSRVHRFAPGDIVYAYSFANRKGGVYAEYVAVVAEHVGHPPDSLMLKEAGAVATTGLTALQGIDDVLRITRSARLCCAYGPMPPDASSAIDSTPQEREPVLSCPPRVSQCITNIRTIWSD